MANLLACKDTGEILFDTNLIAYGLVKSGYMAFQQAWTRRTLRSINLDPNQGSSFNPVVVNGGINQGDNLWGFTVYNAISPIVFLTGSGCLVGTQVSGNAITFFYVNSSASTRFYCFDLMADIYPGSTFLKTWDTAGRITFNSVQPPLNVIAAVRAPGPGAVDRFGRYLTTYAGGSVERWRGDYNYPGTSSYVNVGLSGEEYAAYLPWSRSAECYDTNPVGGSGGPFYRYGSVEGVGGYNGGIQFRFSSSASTTYINLSGNQFTPGLSWSNLPTDRYPVALVIRTSNLIFPYN